jgi:pimeloyl-ACP methyl ester carboxylesterase
VKHKKRFLSLRLGLAVATLALPSGEALAQLRWESYSVGSQGDRIVAELGRLSVPESYTRPASNKITLAFLRFKGVGSRRGPPIFYLAGGPGGSGVADASGARFGVYLEALRKLGDVIALDQRGTGSSEPNLRCPEKFAYPLEQEANLYRLTEEYQKVAAACAAFWRSRGVGLADYNTESSADDVALLARSINAPRIRIFTASYGTHLALAVMRRHPTLVERAVLGGLEGPDQTIKLPKNVDAQLDHVSELIANDPQARKVLPNFRATLTTLVAQLGRNPITVTVPGHTNDVRSARRVRLSAIDVQLLAASLLGRRPTIELIPRIFGPAVSGDYTTLASYVADELREGEISAMGAVMDCASSVSPGRWKEIEFEKPNSVVGTLMDFPLPEWCTTWDVPSLPASFRESIHSSTPVLFIEGSLDGQTPLSNVEELRGGFSNSALFTVIGAGHDPSMFRSSPELLAAIYAFLSGVNTRDKVFTTPPLHFLLPERTVNDTTTNSHD